MDEAGVEVRNRAGDLLGWMTVGDVGDVERTVRFPLRAQLGRRTAAARGLTAEAPPVLALDLMWWRDDAGKRLCFCSDEVGIRVLLRVAVFRKRRHPGAKG